MWNYNIPYKSSINDNKMTSMNNINSANQSTFLPQKSSGSSANYINTFTKYIAVNSYNIKRYLFITIGIFLLYKLIAPYNYEYRTLLLLIFIELLAIMLSSLSLFLFTRLNFINDYKKGNTNDNTNDNKKYKNKENKTTECKTSEYKNNENKTALYILLGFIFLSVHLCVGFSILGIYITQITN